MELRHLEVFRVLAEELHFGRTAQRLFLAQPSVSQQLRRLEDELGVRLVHRTSRSVRLSSAGTAFLAETERVLAAVERARMVARNAAAGEQGVLRMAANYPASRLLLLPLLERLRVRSPGVTTMLRELGSAEQIRELARGDLDLALVYGPIDAPGLFGEHLLDVPVVALMRAQHPLAAREEVTLDEVVSLAYSTGFAGGSTAIEEAIVAAGAQCGVRVRPARSTADLSGYLLELETNDTIAFSSLPRAEHGRAQGMRLARIGPVEPTLGLYAVRADGIDEPLVNSAVGELLQLADERRVWG
ncbi:MAG: LysR family transcriptional regulator [Actinobacteria bacterium]|nr:LysR family transcriptional regulator [Actinomycetota bacterium]